MTTHSNFQWNAPIFTFFFHFPSLPASNRSLKKKTHAMFVALAASYINLERARVVQVTSSFVFMIRNELEVPGDDLCFMVKNVRFHRVCEQQVSYQATSNVFLPYYQLTLIMELKIRSKCPCLNMVS